MTYVVPITEGSSFAAAHVIFDPAAREPRPRSVHGARHFTQSHGRPERSPERADAPEKRPDTTNLKVGIFKRWQHSKAFRNRTKRAPSRVPSQRGEGSRNSGWILYSSPYSRSMIFVVGSRPSPVSPYRLLSVPVSCCAPTSLLGPSFLLSGCYHDAIGMLHICLWLLDILPRRHLIMYLSSSLLSARPFNN